MGRPAVPAGGHVSALFYLALAGLFAGGVYGADWLHSESRAAAAIAILGFAVAAAAIIALVLS